MNEAVLVVVVLRRGGVVRTLHVGRAGTERAGRGLRGRIPAMTSRPPSAPDIHLASPAPSPDRSTTLHYICHYCCYDLFIYARKLNNHDFGGKYRTVQRTHRANRSKSR